MREIHPYPTVWNQYFADNYERLGPCDLFLTSWILRVLHLHCLLGQHCFQIFNIYTILFVLSSHDLAIALFNNRSLAGSSVGLLHFRPCDPHNGAIKKTKGQKDKKMMMMSGQFRTLAMFCWRIFTGRAPFRASQAPRPSCEVGWVTRLVRAHQPQVWAAIGGAGTMGGRALFGPNTSAQWGKAEHTFAAPKVSSTRPVQGSSENLSPKSAQWGKAKHTFAAPKVSSSSRPSENLSTKLQEMAW